MTQAAAQSKKNLRGGEFLVSNQELNTLFFPENANEEQRMVREMVGDFLKNEVWPNLEKTEKMADGYPAVLLEKAAELGLLGTHMPEEFGGMPMDVNTNTIIYETFGPGGSFNVPLAVQTGIGMLPLYYFGTQEQKERFLPGLIDGSIKGAYCLTEPNAGSDALNAQSKAILSEDGSYYSLTGQKMWISNSGFADLFTVFAKIDGEHFTGFLVPANLEGITLGAEEDKLGIKGSSTRQVFFENVKVPVENLLGEKGKGHLIAFNVLNIGRYKLGVMCLGGCKKATDLSTKYANERKQFKVPISSFGAIKYKLGQQAILTYALECATYRTSQLMQGKIEELEHQGKSSHEADLQSAEEYAIECAMMKVLGSEVLDYVVDEMVQVYGGNGFSEEFPAARAYRDARINRIYEGTSEINRLLIVKMLMKRAMQGKIDITTAAWNVQKELKNPVEEVVPEGVLGKEQLAVAQMKKAVLLVVGAGAKYQMDGKLDLTEEQEIVSEISDMIMQVYMSESILLRHLAKLERGEELTDVEVSLTKVYIQDALDALLKHGKDALASFANEKDLSLLLGGLKHYCDQTPINVKKHRRVVADFLIEENGYTI